jgi:hypothetical protein
VVATEVKQLAATTTRSTADINATLSTLEHYVAAMAAVIADATDGGEGIGREATELAGVAELQRASMAALDHAVQGALQRIAAMASATEAIERRAHGRVQLDGFVELRTRSGVARAALLDLSEGGLRCLVDGSVSLPADRSLEVVLILGPRSQTIPGLIVRETLADVEREVGVQFSSPSAAQVALVRDYISAVQGSASTIPNWTPRPTRSSGCPMES